MAQEQNQQQDFSELALAKFLTAFPELGNLIVTFNDVSHDLSESDGMQVGIFILRSGPEVFYVPCVSKDANIYPIDSIFFASKTRFFPLTKKTVGLVLNSNQTAQGKGRKIPSTVVKNPDLTALVNPPRTGKFVQASVSHLSDFMASLPDHVKQFTLEKLAEEKSVYENLHKIFGLKDIFEALQVKPKGMPAMLAPSPISIVTGSAEDLTGDEITSILDKGYYVRGTPEFTRTAIGAVEYNDNIFTNVVELDGGTDYEIMFSNGSSREAFIPKMLNVGQYTVVPRSTTALFTNGDYATSSDFIAKGTKLDRTTVLDTIFEHNPPILPKDLENGDTFAIIDSDAKLLGIFRANKVILNHMGVEISVDVQSGMPYGTYKISAYRNYATAPTLADKELFIPFASLVIRLGENVSSDVERSVNTASRRHEITQMGMLGDQINLGFDGVEFVINGKTVGQEKEAMQRLVVEESIDPTLAVNFIKEAREKKFAKIYLSKKASAGLSAGEIPQFGEIAPPPDKTGLNGSFIPNVQKSLAVGDAQTTEATVISELLQTPDTYDLIEQYLPDIEQAVDRLGRILLLSRVHVNQLSENNDTENLFSFLANLKSVYRMLGDNLIKLQELVVLKPNEKK